MYELLDHYLGLVFNDWPSKFQAVATARVAGAIRMIERTTARPAETGRLQFPDGCVGTYRDRWYGDISLTRNGPGLSIDFKSTPRMTGPLEHWGHDSFFTHFTDRSIEPGLVTFAFDPEGHVSYVTMKPASPVADFSYDYQDLDFKPAHLRR